MKRTPFTLAAAFLVLTLGSASASTICPTTANTNTDCGYIITIGSGGVISGAAVPNANPYDGSDDALIGVINNSGLTYNSSFTLTGSGNAGGIFDFDGDGICTFVSEPYCANAATGYEGPLNTFSNITTTSVFDDTGNVNITGLAAGSTTYFSLENPPSSIVIGFAPEPSTWTMLAAGLLGMGYISMRRRRRNPAPNV